MRRRMRPLGTAMWGSLGLIAWTHVGYPAVVALAASRRTARRPAPERHLPTVTLVIVAHNEERVIRERLENALALDYPRDRLDVVVSLDGCTDATRDVVAELGVAVIDNPRLR